MPIHRQDGKEMLAFLQGMLYIAIGCQVQLTHFIRPLDDAIQVGIEFVLDHRFHGDLLKVCIHYSILRHQALY